MVKQYYGIKYPFSNDNLENLYIDLNESYEDSIKSKVLHVLFTPKGQKLRNPEFGTDLIKYIFQQNDEMTIEDLKTSLASDIAKYVNDVKFEDISFEKSDNSLIVIVHYSTKKGNSTEINSVAVKLN